MQKQKLYIRKSSLLANMQKLIREKPNEKLEKLQSLF